MDIHKSNLSDSKRKDRHGNPITTEIGRFSLVSKKKKKTVVGAGTGGKEEESVTGEQSEFTDKKTRHRVTFMDEITNDKSQLTEVHLIESYKKYN